MVFLPENDFFISVKVIVQKIVNFVDFIIIIIAFNKNLYRFLVIKTLKLQLDEKKLAVRVKIEIKT